MIIKDKNNDINTPEKILEHLVDIGLIYFPKRPKEFKEIPAYPIVKYVLDANQKLYEGVNE